MKNKKEEVVAEAIQVKSAEMLECPYLICKKNKVPVPKPMTDDPNMLYCKSQCSGCKKMAVLTREEAGDEIEVRTDSGDYRERHEEKVTVRLKETVAFA